MSRGLFRGKIGKEPFLDLFLVNTHTLIQRLKVNYFKDLTLGDETRRYVHNAYKLGGESG
jgi:hypothetical protein